MTNKICIAEDTQGGTYHPILFYPSPKPSEYDEDYWRHYSYAHLTEGFASFEEAYKWASEHASEDGNLEFVDVTISCNGLTGTSVVYYFKR
jgi:hypothetical protein